MNCFEVRIKKGKRPVFWLSVSADSFKIMDTHTVSFSVENYSIPVTGQFPIYSVSTVIS